MRSEFRYRRGEKIGGRYLVHQPLRGGMGEVYLCLDLEQNVPRALKTFQTGWEDQDRLRREFEREVGTWVALEKHANIVRCFYLDTVDHTPFLFLEWVASDERHGTDLRSWLNDGPLEPRLALDFALDICRGLIHASEKQPGIVHRDLKPDNVLVAQGPVAKITDFGLARTLQAAGLEPPPGADAIAQLTSLGGTPLYMAPEQWRGERLDVRTDLYALGCMLYEMLSGGPPYRGPSLEALQRQHCEAPRPSLTGGDRLRDELAQVAARCLAEAHGDRYPSAEALAEALSGLYRSHSFPPRPAPRAGEFTPVDFNNRGLTYHALQRFDAALADYTRAIELDPGDAEAYTNRGTTYHALRRFDAALADYARAIELDPGLAAAYYNRGSTYGNLQRFGEALADYARAIELDPGYAAAYSNRGITYGALQRFEEALADYTRAIELDPGDASAYSNRGNTYHALQRFDAALSDYARAIELDPRYASAYYNRGNTYHALQRFEEALSDYARAIELDPGDATAYYNRGTTYHALQRFDAALADYTRAIELDPGDATSHFNAGALLANAGRLEEALPYLERSAVLGQSGAADTLQSVQEALGR